MKTPLPQLRALRRYPTVGLVGALLFASACGTSSPSHSPAVGSLAVVLGSHANEAAPMLTPSSAATVSSAISSGAYLAVVEDSGRPQVIAAGSLTASGSNSEAKSSSRSELNAEVSSELIHARATSPQANPLQALEIAARELADQPAPKTILMVDDLLQTVPPVAFQHSGILGAAPADVAKYLQKLGELPRLNGIAIVLSGVGDTAGPQQSLSSAERSHLIAIWTAILKQAGASSVVVDSTPLTAAPRTGLPPVTRVPVAPLPAGLSGCSPSITVTDSEVAFQPGRSVYRDPATAAYVLSRVAKTIGKCGWKTVHLTGTTADAGSTQYRLDLSRARAHVVATTLVHLGLSRARVQSKGVGSSFAGFTPDRSSTGVLLPGPAERNRTVVIRLAR